MIKFLNVLKYPLTFCFLLFAHLSINAQSCDDGSYNWADMNAIFSAALCTSCHQGEDFNVGFSELSLTNYLAFIDGGVVCGDEILSGTTLVSIITNGATDCDNNTVGGPMNNLGLPISNDDLVAIQTWIDAGANEFCEQTVAWVTPELCVTLEGPYDETNNMMSNVLQQIDNLPDVQSYNQPPWNYEGNEGLGWTAADYPAGTVDWVLVSFRTSPTASTEIAQTAAILQQDGCLFFPNPNVLSTDAASAVYVVIEHRNHIAVMTPSSVNIVNSTLTYDFRLNDSYKDAASSGQKQLANGFWTMFAADCEQSNPSGYDINGQDKAVWEISNGIFNDYLIPDINMDGDVNGADKALWNDNNGIFSAVPK